MAILKSQDWLQPHVQSACHCHIWTVMNNTKIRLTDVKNCQNVLKQLAIHRQIQAYPPCLFQPTSAATKTTMRMRVLLPETEVRALLVPLILMTRTIPLPPLMQDQTHHLQSYRPTLPPPNFWG